MYAEEEMDEVWLQIGKGANWSRSFITSQMFVFFTFFWHFHLQGAVLADGNLNNKNKLYTD